MNRAYWTEMKYEFLKQSRMRTYVLSALLFPLAFYAVFGIAMGWQRQPGMEALPRNMMASYGSFGVIGVCLFGFGGGIAVERGLGWLEVKRASPMPAFLASDTNCSSSNSFGRCHTTFMIERLSFSTGERQKSLESITR